MSVFTGPVQGTAGVLCFISATKPASDAQFGLLTNGIRVGGQQGTNILVQILLYLFRSPTGEIFRTQLRFDLLAAQPKGGIGFHAGNHVVGLAFLLDHSSSGHSVLT